MTDSKLVDIVGVGAVTASRLSEKGLKTVKSVAKASLNALSDATGFPALRVEGIQQEAAALLKASGDDSAGTKKKNGKKKKKKSEKKGKRSNKKGSKKKKK
jgi:nucleotidyltransferase/DNA polymerase involved in DNA repair